jgi:predicted AAA+ superfamily ATPase
MDSERINQFLAQGDVTSPEVLPQLDTLRLEPFQFRHDFGLNVLPNESGMLLVRGARQYGKSTWLQQQIHDTVQQFGPASALYLNGDSIRNDTELVVRIRRLLPMYRKDALVHRLFIDEITAIDDWQRALKTLIDAGELKKVLVITTGSRAADLRHGTERLPGRKGKLDRTSFLFTPISFSDFRRVCGGAIQAERLLPAYLLSGGSPLACSHLAQSGTIPEYVIETTRDWIYGEFAASGRSRGHLLAVMECLFRFAGTPVGQSKLAREADLANNTVAVGYTGLLADLLCSAMSYGWDPSRERPNRRQPCKFHMTNLLAATAWHPKRLRSIDDYFALSPGEQGGLLEWLVAQELWRRAAIQNVEMPEIMSHWNSKTHELDFVQSPDRFIEVKRGTVSPHEFSWFGSTFPTGNLTVIGESRFDLERIQAITMTDFLLQS